MLNSLLLLMDKILLSYGNYGIFLIMGNAGFCPSTVWHCGRFVVCPSALDRLLGRSEAATQAAHRSPLQFNGRFRFSAHYIYMYIYIHTYFCSLTHYARIVP